VHEISAPIIVPSNVEVAGEGSDLTFVKSLMLDPIVMQTVCAWDRGNCAAFTVNNIR
jgi:hypothetical protein